jgi:hypothetical protein
VKEDGGLPIEVVGVERGKIDLKTQLANQVRDSVVPAPQFSIGVVEMPNKPDFDVAVIRVQEGDWPPYMFIRSGKNKISIRNQDNNVAANLREMEQLFSSRSALSSGSAIDDVSTRVPVIYDSEGHDRERSNFYFRLSIVPLSRGASIVLDESSEREIKKLVDKQLSRLSEGSARVDSTVIERRANHFELVWAWPKEECHEKWRFDSDGAVLFATGLERLREIEGGKGKIIDLETLALQLLNVIGVSRELLNQRRWSGRSVIRSELYMGGEAKPLRGVRLSGQGGPVVGANYEQVVEMGVLERPGQFLSEAFLYLLRDVRGADVSLDTLRNSIEPLITWRP